MSLNVAVQMDPIENINIKGDSTFAMMLEAQRARPHAVLLPDENPGAGGRHSFGHGP